MDLLSLWFESKEDSLSVRRFAIREAMSTVFEVNVWALSENDDIDLESIVGRAASFGAQGQATVAFPGGRRVWTGICRHFEQQRTESTGLTSYHLSIVPALWLLSQRTNHRAYQHLSAPEIVAQMLLEWHIDADWKLDPSQYPKLLLRTQYGESDLAFMSRILEEAGISFFFRPDEAKGTVLTFADAPHAAEQRAGGPIEFQDSPVRAHETLLEKLLDPSSAKGREYVSEVRVSRQVRPGKVTLRDHDFRQKPDYSLLGCSGVTGAENIEQKLEVYRYSPGAFVVEMGNTTGNESGLAGLAVAAPSQPVAVPRAAVAATPSGAVVADQKKNFGQQILEGLGGQAADIAVGALESAVFSDDASGTTGQKKGIKEQVYDGIVKGSGSLVTGQVTKLVQGPLTTELTGKLGKYAGGMVGAFTGHLAGDLAGMVVRKIVGAIASPLAPSSPNLAGDDKAVARSDEKQGAALAMKQLESLRADRFSIDFSTNAIDLSPGCVFSMLGHAKKLLAEDKRLLITDIVLEGTQDSSWNVAGRAVLAAEAYRPPLKTPKPQVLGLQSAVVVGPPGEEIHTDELGRVRVQFHWDREGSYDDNSCCWIRVAQGSAGAGFGMIQLPRVGQEVLVGFLEGDPDQPMVLGSVFNNTTPVPHGLPGRKTRSSWKSSTYPGGGGSNEVMLEDAKGQELLYLLAEKHMQQVVKHDRGAVIGQVDSTVVGTRHEVQIAQPFGTPPDQHTLQVMIDKRIELTTGDAKIVLEKDTITLWAKKGIKVLSEGDKIEIETKKGDVRIQGGPDVRINCPPPEEKKKKSKKAGAAPGAAGDAPSTGAKFSPETQPAVSGPPGVPKMPPGVDLDANVAEAKKHAYNGLWFKDKVRNNKEGRPDSWDYKQLGAEYQDFGNFNYGVTGSAVGIPGDILLKQAGKAQKAAGTSKPEWGDPGIGGVLGGTAPYGDDPHDQEMIQSGIDYYKTHYEGKK